MMQRLMPCLDRMWINTRYQRLHALTRQWQHQATAIAAKSLASVRAYEGRVQVLKIGFETYFHHSPRGQCQPPKKRIVHLF